MKEDSISGYTCEHCCDQGIIKYIDSSGYLACPECELGKALMCTDCEITLENHAGLGYCPNCGSLYIVDDSVLTFLDFMDKSWLGSE